MAKGCKKCDPHEICEECPEWIFTLADLIMCMMGLFVLLWVLKPSGNPNPSSNPGQQSAAVKAEQQRLDDVMKGIREAFGNGPEMITISRDDYQKILRRLGELNPTKNAGMAENKSDGAEGLDPTVTSIRLGKQTAEGGPLSFEAGSATVSKTMRDRVAEIAKNIRGHRNIVMVRGHTSLDDFAEDGSAEEKMALSIKRAQAIADLLIANKVEPDILRVQGCSTFEPVKQREYTSSSQSINRRVEVEVTATLVSELQDSRK